MHNNHSMIKIGKILTSHGLNGDVKLASFCEKPEDIFNIKLYGEDGTPMPCHRVGSTSYPDIFLAKFDSMNSSKDTIPYRNFYLFMDEKTSKTDAAADNFIYLEELIGMTVTDGERRGKILAISNYGAGDIMDVSWEIGKDDDTTTTTVEAATKTMESILIADNLLENVDRAGKIVRIRKVEYV